MPNSNIAGSALNTSTPLSRGERILRNSQRNNIVRNLNETENTETTGVQNDVSEQSSFQEVVNQAGIQVSRNFGLVANDDDELVDNGRDENDTQLVENVESEKENNLSTDRSKRVKRKTPKESRMEEPKSLLKKENLITKVNRKTFKENFNTDKSRLDKRQPKLGNEQDFLIIVRDNIHQAGMEHSAKSAGKLMVYGKGSVKRDFMGEGIKFNKDEYYVHANSHNFEEEIYEKDSDEEDNDDSNGENEAEEDTREQRKKKSKKSKPKPSLVKSSLNNNYNAVKVCAPGTSLLDVNSDNDDDSL